VTIGLLYLIWFDFSSGLPEGGAPQNVMDIPSWKLL